MASLVFTDGTVDKTETSTEQETKTDREHERILNEIETTDTAFIGASLRAVYEGNDHAKFLDRLDCRIKQHDRDIERMCNFHYQGFIESITELINVRSDAERLKNQTLIINKELQESGKEVARKSDDLIQCQLQQRNVASAIEKLSMCLPVLQMYAKMCEQMKAGRYYSALKTLEQLEHTHLPLIFQYRFCEIMKNNIPKIREEIKDVSMKELKDFLESVRKNSDKIGMVAMKQQKLAQNKLSNVVIVDKNANGGNPFKIEKSDENPFETEGSVHNPFSGSSNSHNPFETKSGIENDLSASDLVDFSPVYKCLHIFGLVGAQAQFETYYRTQRKNQARLVLEPPATLQDNPEAFAQYFYQIV
uniref:Exocyst complex component EXOC6/Sec15 N-terminal domain-containing protein n=1 Tax=Ciona intestinalis TaxID=7719 RepID=F6R924_CIOIN